jgi:AhpD family alkylhydroperoxidase
MSDRIDFMQQSPELTKKLVELEGLLRRSSIEEPIQDLVKIRASQINGCAFCTDMHIKQATLRGERPLRIYHLTAWHESPLFSPRERAALAWAEALTRLPPQGVADDEYARVAAQLSAQEMSDLAYVVAAINAWNRLSIGFRTEPGSRDKAYGLDKAGLS